MQIRADTLRKVLELLKPVVPRKSGLPVLEYVLLSNNRAVATDMETMVTVDLAEPTEDCLLPHSTMLDLLKTVPGYDRLSIEARPGRLILRWSDGDAVLEVPNPRDFPVVPEFKPETEGSLNGDALVSALAAALPYAATEDTRPVLNAVTVTLGESTEVAAADGFRMLYHVLPDSFPREAKLVLPSKAVRVLAHLWRRAPAPPAPSGSLIQQITSKRPIQLGLEGKRCRFAFGDITVLVQLVEGSPPNFANVIPTPATELAVWASDLERALRRVEATARGGNGAVRLSWTESELTVSVREDEREVRATLPVKTSGQPGRLALNIRYLLDYLKGRDGVICVGPGSSTEPILFRQESRPRVVIMPMEVEW